MRRRERLSLILALALLAGQWLSASHGSDHLMQPDAMHACAVCVFTDTSGSGALPAFCSGIEFAATEVPHAALAPAAASLAPRHHPIRGPPAFLA